MIRLFESGNEASAAVLATALYQALPAADDLADRPGGGRKLLAFSDSRQAAAFFAPYLESSHSLVQQRRLILDGLARATARDATCTVDDLIEATAAAAGDAGVFGRRESRQGRRREAARWVMRELVALDERQSLEGLGLLRVRLDRDPSWPPPRPLLDLGLTGEECWLLLAELLRTLRLQGALTMPEEVDPADEMFDPRRGPIYVRGDGAEARLKVLSWLPTRGVNKRLDYLRRLLAVAGVPGRPTPARCWPAAGGRSRALRDGWLRSAGAAQDRPGAPGRPQLAHARRRCLPRGDVAVRRVPAAFRRRRCAACARRSAARAVSSRPRTDDDEHYRALVPADRAGLADRARAHRPVDRARGVRHPAAVPGRRGQRAVLLHHVRARRRRRRAERGAAAQHAADHRQLHPAGRASRAAQRHRRASAHLRPAPLARPVPLPGAGSRC